MNIEMQMKSPHRIPTSYREYQFNSWLFHLLSSFLLMNSERQQVMAQVLQSLSPTWESQMKTQGLLLAPTARAFGK